MITSVNRDELEDGGAAIFAETIRQTRQLSPGCTIEVLIPDFEGNETALAMVCAEMPEILNHNIETVRRLFPAIRPQGKYQRSIELLGKAKQLGMRTKSGLILGMGETMDEAREVMRDLRCRRLRHHDHRPSISNRQESICPSPASTIPASLPCSKRRGRRLASPTSNQARWCAVRITQNNR